MMDKQLDLDAPLLSTRRPESKTANPNPSTKPIRSVLPFYKSDLKTGPIRNPGVVPFHWEQSPGQPKPVNKAGGSNNPNLNNPIDFENENDFEDALDSLSISESFFMNCSVNEVNEAPDGSRSGGMFLTDPHVRDFMMGRFLPAAKAMATESPVVSGRKVREPVRVIERVESRDGEQKNKLRFPLNYDEGTSVSYENVDDSDDDGYDEYYDGGNMFRKGCGLIPKFCLLNPVVPGIKGPSCKWTPSNSVRRVRGGTQVKEMQAEEEHSWEAVYKHKQMYASPISKENDGKIKSESNHLTYISDSLTADGSSPQYNSNISGVSPYRNEPSQSPFQEGKGFLGVPRRDGNSSLSGGSNSFGSMSPTVDRTLHVDTSLDDKGINRSNDKDSEIEIESGRIQECLVLETCDTDAFQNSSCEVLNEINGATNENKKFRPNEHDNRSFSLKQNMQVKNDAYSVPPLLPPPLPNSPSESWLNRTLPSVSTKNSSAQSFLGIHFQTKKQVSTPSLIPKEISAKAPKAQRGPTRFADMLAKPLSPRSEI